MPFQGNERLSETLPKFDSLRVEFGENIPPPTNMRIEISFSEAQCLDISTAGTSPYGRFFAPP
jgi:hypothetical protein